MIKQLVKKTGLLLKDLDVDIFSNIRSLVQNYQLDNEMNVLIDIQREYICIIFIKDEEFYLSNIVSLKNKDNSTIVNVGEINDILLKELKRIIFGHKIVNKIEDLNTIFLTGGELIHELYTTISEQINAPVEILNPFNKIAISQTVTNKDEFKKNPEKFSSSVGVALKNFK